MPKPQNLPVPVLDGNEARLRKFAELLATGLFKPFDAAIQAGYSDASAKHWDRMKATVIRRGYLAEATSKTNKETREKFHEVIRRAQDEVQNNLQTRLSVRDGKKVSPIARLKACDDIDKLAGFNVEILRDDPEFQSYLKLDTEELKQLILAETGKASISIEQILAKLQQPQDADFEVVEGG